VSSHSSVSASSNAPVKGTKSLRLEARKIGTMPTPMPNAVSSSTD
jgi:hypothetical protein